MPRKEKSLKIGAPDGSKHKVSHQVKVKMNTGGMRLTAPPIKQIMMGPVGAYLVSKALNAIKKKVGLGLKRAGQGVLRAGEKRKGGRKTVYPRK